VLVNKGSYFSEQIMKRKQKNKFKDNLILIAIDEAHTLWAWQGFRKAFAMLRELRSCFPKTPVCALSATFPNHIIHYVVRIMGMPTPTHIITVDGRRPNINVIVSPQLPGSIKQLHDIIPEGIKYVKDIPKTLIFVDTVLQARTIARSMRRYLWSQFTGEDPIHQCKTAKVIRSYYSCLSKVHKDETLESFRNSTTRITIATDAFSLGVDIADIDKVIQWGVDDTLDLCTLVQRIGRAARKQESQGVAVIYASRKLIDPIPREWEEAWTTSLDDQNSTAAAELEPEDDEWETIHENLIQCIGNFRERDLTKFSIPVTHQTKDKVKILCSHMYHNASSAEAAIKEDDEERKKGLITNGCVTDKKKAGHHSVDPSVLWFLNTVGCRNRLILTYLGYPDVFADEKQRSWCCDVCAWAKTKDPGTDLCHGVRLQESIVVELGPKAAPRKKNLPTYPERFTEEQYITIAPKVQLTIETWRKRRLQHMLDIGLLSSGLPSSLILPDPVVETVIKTTRCIQTVDSLRAVMIHQGMHIDTGTIRTKDVEILFHLIEKSIACFSVNGTVFLSSIFINCSYRRAYRSNHRR
jgi:hypothetical protein